MKKNYKKIKFIILTEKEIQLLELFLKIKNQFQKIRFYRQFGNIQKMQILILLKHIFTD